MTTAITLNAVLLVALALGGCAGESTRVSGSSADGGSGPGVDGSNGAGRAGSGSMSCPDEDAVRFERGMLHVPSFMLLMDVSAGLDAPMLGGTTIWGETCAGLEILIPGLPDGLHLGLTTFPDLSYALNPPGCDEGFERLYLGPLDETWRKNFDGLFGPPDGPQVLPGGPRSPGAPLAYSQSRLLNAVPGVTNSIIVVLGGLPTHDDACEPVEEQVANGPLTALLRTGQSRGVRTHVVGTYGSEEARPFFSELARAGGSALELCSDEGPFYCHVDLSGAEDYRNSLAAALRGLIKQDLALAGCVFPVPESNREPNELTLVKRDAEGDTVLLQDDPLTCNVGWHYVNDGKSLELCPSSCLSYLDDPTAQIVVPCPFADR